MREEKVSVKPIIINSVFILIAFLIQYNSVFSIKIGGANPMLPLCVCISLAMFSGELSAVVFSLVAGIITDSAAATPVCFNTVLFILISLAVSLTVRYLFNNNIRSAVVIGIFGSAFYYIIRFIVCIPKQTLENNVGYILRYILPSVIYSTVFIVLFYLLDKLIFSKYSVR